MLSNQILLNFNYILTRHAFELLSLDVHVNPFRCVDNWKPKNVQVVVSKNWIQSKIFRFNLPKLLFWRILILIANPLSGVCTTYCSAIKATHIKYHNKWHSLLTCLQRISRKVLEFDAPQTTPPPMSFGEKISQMQRSLAQRDKS